MRYWCTPNVQKQGNRNKKNTRVAPGRKCCCQADPIWASLEVQGEGSWILQGFIKKTKHYIHQPSICDVIE